MGLIHLAPHLEAHGYTVVIIDQFADPEWEKKFEESLEERPVCFGVTSMTGPQLRQAIGISRRVKEKDSGIPVVWGGVHTSIRPVEVLENNYVDVVVIGEGEVTLAELTDALVEGHSLSEVKGIGYKEGDRQFFTGSRPFLDLAQEPDPAYHLIDMANYHEDIMGVDHMHLFGSRGCIYDCAYCWDPVVNQRKHRVTAPGRIAEQMIRIIRDYGIRGFVFGDDNFFIDMEWAHEVLEGIVRAGLDVHLGKVFIRADTASRMGKETLDLMVRAGVKRVVIGAESGDPRILKLIKKRISVDEIIAANRTLRPYPIRPAFLFMMGLPTETPAEVEKTVRLAEQLMRENPSATRSFNRYTPFPGTELFKMVVQMGFREPARLEEWAKLNYRNLPADCSWISPETRKLVSILDYALMCDKHDNALGEVKKADPLSVALAKIYGPLARYRIRSMDTRLPIEPILTKTIRKVIGRDRG